MSAPAAKRGDRVVATDVHVVLMPSPSGLAATAMTLPFDGALDGALSPDVWIENQPAATDGSRATNQPGHVAPLGGRFPHPPADAGVVRVGARSVHINNRPAARAGDAADTCHDAAGAPGRVVARGRVRVGV
jgi:uncharacterized Zn-binding protein involved in type VI secretion